MFHELPAASKCPENQKHVELLQMGGGTNDQIIRAGVPETWRSELGSLRQEMNVKRLVLSGM